MCYILEFIMHAYIFILLHIYSILIGLYVFISEDTNCAFKRKGKALPFRKLQMLDSWVSCMRQGMLTLSGAPSTTSLIGYYHPVYNTCTLL